MPYKTRLEEIRIEIAKIRELNEVYKALKLKLSYQTAANERRADKLRELQAELQAMRKG
jgi:hypothetical protein